MLLDPSLMEQARRAAGKFQAELNAAADRVLRKVFSRRRFELGHGHNTPMLSDCVATEGQA